MHVGRVNPLVPFQKTLLRIQFDKLLVYIFERSSVQA